MMKKILAFLVILLVVISLGAQAFAEDWHMTWEDWLNEAGAKGVITYPAYESWLDYPIVKYVTPKGHVDIMVFSRTMNIANYSQYAIGKLSDGERVRVLAEEAGASCILADNGVFGWVSSDHLTLQPGNRYGYTKIVTAKDMLEAKVLTGLKNAVQVADGLGVTAVLYADGLVDAFSIYEQAFDGKYHPMKAVKSWDNVVQIACGDDFVVGVRADGEALSTHPEVASMIEDWGMMRQLCVLGRGDVYGLDVDGSVYGVPGILWITTAVEMAMESAERIFLRTDTGEVFLCEWNEETWNVTETTLKNIVKIVSGRDLTAALDSEGKVFIIEDSAIKLCQTDYIEDIAASGNCVIGLLEDGKAVNIVMDPLVKQDVSLWRGAEKIFGGSEGFFGLVGLIL